MTHVLGGRVRVDRATATQLKNEASVVFTANVQAAGLRVAGAGRPGAAPTFSK